MRDSNPGVSHFIAGAAAAHNPHIRIRIVGIVHCVVIPLLQHQNRACWQQRRYIWFVYMIVMPSSTPFGNLADWLGEASFRIENLQRGSIHT